MVLHAGAVSDLAGTAAGNGATAVDGTAGGLGGWEGWGAVAHEVSKAAAPHRAVAATVRRAAPMVMM